MWREEGWGVGGKGSRETNEEALDNRGWRLELGGGVEMERSEWMSGGGMKPEALVIGGWGDVRNGDNQG